ncbi:hypothetical protein WDZ17_04815 [Pseudokineococcus basanitobsidens]|uniref:Lipoprotein n=1 Tax=Pseudokineococcus basanitobsidens TaxID=1926649 RepID=A0ABU8RHW5_9ACTN
MSHVSPHADERPAPTAEPTGARRGRRPAWVLGVGGLAVGLVVGGCSGLGVGAVGGAALVADGSSLGDLLTGDGGDERTVAEALPDELPRLRAFVAEERGLAWEREVPVEALDDEAFETALAGPDAGDAGPRDAGEGDAVEGDAVEGDAELEEDGAVALDDPDGGRAETYAALGLTPSATAYREAWDDGDSAVTGFYDTETREVVLRGQTWTPAVEETLVHELTHALDDQHVDLDAVVAEGATPEQVSAATAVVEGSAEAVAWAWYDTLDDDRLDAYDEAWEVGPEDGTPEGEGVAEGDPAYDPLLDALSLFPYDYGYVAVEAVGDDGGPEAVDELLRAPLTTTEQVLAARPDPGAVPGLAPAVEVDAPTAPEGVEVLGSGTLGLFPLALLPQVAQAGDEGYWLDPEDVVTHAWTGDAWTTWVDPADDDRACTAVLVRLEDARGRDDLLDALGPWVADASDVGAALEPVGDGDLRLTGCGER